MNLNMGQNSNPNNNVNLGDSLLICDVGQQLGLHSFSRHPLECSVGHGPDTMSILKNCDPKLDLGH